MRRARSEELHRVVLQLQATDGVEHPFALLTEVTKRAAHEDCERRRHLDSRRLTWISHTTFVQLRFALVGLIIFLSWGTYFFYRGIWYDENTFASMSELITSK